MNGMRLDTTCGPTHCEYDGCVVAFRRLVGQRCSKRFEETKVSKSEAGSCPPEKIQNTFSMFAGSLAAERITAFMYILVGSQHVKMCNLSDWNLFFVILQPLAHEQRSPSTCLSFRLPEGSCGQKGVACSERVIITTLFCCHWKNPKIFNNTVLNSALQCDYAEYDPLDVEAQVHKTIVTSKRCIAWKCPLCIFSCT